MTVSYVTPPASTALTLLATVKTEMGITAGTDDAYLNTLIGQASETISAWAGRGLHRAQYLETHPGNGLSKIVLSRFPVATLDTLLSDTTAITDAIIDDREAGILFRSAGFGTFTSSARWNITYTAGHFLPGDDYTGSISVAASDDSYNSATAAFPALIRAGDWIYASGFSNAANNGLKLVSAATTSKITTPSASALVDEVAASRSLGFRTLPGWIERVAIELVKLGYQGRDRDSSLRSLSIGHASFAFDRMEGVKPLRQEIQRLALPL